MIIVSESGIKITSGFKDVTAAGTAEALSATRLIVLNLDITANETNTGKVAIGSATADAGHGAHTMHGKILTPGSSYNIGGKLDLSKMYIDSAVDGEGITYNYFTEA